MGATGASRESPNDTFVETLSSRFSEPNAAPLLTAAPAWQHEKEEMRKN